MKFDAFSNAKILVVGGAGFVGSNLVHQLLKHSPSQIVVIDNFLSSEPTNIPVAHQIKIVHGSVTTDRVLGQIPDDINYAFHLACFHGNQSSIADPMADHENNTLTSLRLFDALKEKRTLKKVVYAAAACAVAKKTYDQPEATIEDEPISLFHDSPYSISKIIGELYGNYYFERDDLPFVKARFSNVYGPREILGAGQWRGTPHTIWRNVIPTFIWRSIKGEALPLDNGGNASRDFIYVEDMALGLMSCAVSGRPGEAYNLATGTETTIFDLAHKINELTGNRCPVDLRPARDWDRSGKRFASVEKSKRDLDFMASTDIESGLTKTIAWTLSNRATIQQNIDKHGRLLA